MLPESPLESNLNFLPVSALVMLVWILAFCAAFAVLETLGQAGIFVWHCWHWLAGA